MRLYAQHGSMPGQKILQGITQSSLDGVIFSPKDISPPKLIERLDELEQSGPNTDRLFDPQIYVCFIANNGDARIGYLSDEYLEENGAYFNPRRRNQLERERQVIGDLSSCMRFQSALNVTGIIAPNILIPRSFDSIEAAISKNFIRLAKEEYADLHDSRPVYATLAVSRNALTDKQELLNFLNEITVLDNPPDGFYVLVAADSVEARAEVYNADVIAGWMLINYVLNINGFDVINGYSDIMSPFLGAVGGSAGAFGWWANLRVFAMDRFAPALGGGRLPNQRYLSTRLLNRITYYELDRLRNVVPAILNGLPTDTLYDPETGSEPERNQEVLQSWEAIRNLNTFLSAGDVPTSLQQCRRAIEDARITYEEIGARSPLPLDTKSNADHLEALQEGIDLFRRLAEIDIR